VMNRLRTGISAHRNLKPAVFRKADYVEVKKITKEEVCYYKSMVERPLYFHLQYTADDRYYLPSAMSLQPLMNDIAQAYLAGQPEIISLHFGPASSSISLDTETYIAVADAPLVEPNEILQRLEENLKLLKCCFPKTRLLVENLEFIPESMSGGSCRYIQEADFFSSAVRKWNEEGILDGIIFDVAHGLITAANHPYYNGLEGDPEDTDWDYIRLLKEGEKDILECYKNYLSLMPLDLVEEVHLSGILCLDSGVWVDAHREIGRRELEAFELLLGKIPPRNLSITLEYYRNSETAIEQLETIQTLLKSEPEEDTGKASC
jgi:uncharacterized protein (UPF0276 family)